MKIIRARQLQGSNIHPVCRVRVINSIKQTKIQKATNHPYFNEIFFFNFHLSESELCDEMISFEICNSRTFRSDMKIGTFKIDLADVYSQVKHFGRVRYRRRRIPLHWGFLCVFHLLGTHSATA